MHTATHAGPASSTERRPPAARRTLDSRRRLPHVLGALAHGTEKALRDAPSGFGDYLSVINARTPHELRWHMTGVIGYARWMLHDGDVEPPRIATLDLKVDGTATYRGMTGAARTRLAVHSGADHIVDCRP